MVVALSAQSQNLIVNGSFENGSCPRSFSERPADFKVDGWYSIDGSTPDYYDPCSNADASVPKNWAGIQYPIDGNAFVGIYLKKGLYQENLGTQLKEPLQEGEVYKIQFSISHACNAELLGTEISVALSPFTLRLDHLKKYDHRQHVFKIQEPRNYDDFDWRTITFDYTAKGGEKYFYIGPLCNMSNEKRVPNIYRVYEEPQLNSANYVFIDNVLLSSEDLNPTPEPTFSILLNDDPLYIFFEFDRYDLSNTELDKLDSLSDYLLDQDLHLLITGATDSLGSKEYNHDLGLQRAEAVANYLSFTGVALDRLKTISKGESTPEYANHTDEYRSLNRNALIEFYTKSLSD